MRSKRSHEPIPIYAKIKINRQWQNTKTEWFYWNPAHKWNWWQVVCVFSSIRDLYSIFLRLMGRKFQFQQNMCSSCQTERKKNYIHLVQKLPTIRLISCRSIASRNIKSDDTKKKKHRIEMVSRAHHLDASTLVNSDTLLRCMCVPFDIHSHSFGIQCSDESCSIEDDTVPKQFYRQIVSTGKKMLRVFSFSSHFVPAATLLKFKNTPNTCPVQMFRNRLAVYLDKRIYKKKGTCRMSNGKRIYLKKKKKKERNEQSKYLAHNYIAINFISFHGLYIFGVLRVSNFYKV